MTEAKITKAAAPRLDGKSAATLEKSLSYVEKKIAPALENVIGAPLNNKTIYLDALPKNIAGLTRSSPSGGGAEIILNYRNYNGPFFGDLYGEIAADRASVYGRTASDGDMVAYGDLDGGSAEYRAGGAAYAKHAAMLKYFQIHPHVHETVHKMLADSGYDDLAIENLFSMGLDEFEITAYREMVTEKKAIDAYLAAGEHDLASLVYQNSPHKDLIEAAYKIDAAYSNSGGFDGFMADVALGTAPDSFVTRYLGGLDAGYSSFAPLDAALSYGSGGCDSCCG